MADQTPASPDQIEGAPHPRETPQVFGQTASEAAFLEAFATDRMHHAWLLTGPKGIGKATLAWRMARFLLATPDVAEDDMFGAPALLETLDISPEHPVARRLMAGSDPGLVSVTRSVNDNTGRMRNDIVVDDIRRLNGFFQMSAAEGGRRVVIVDSADEMNVNAANALLKMLEEPPERAILLLISHQPMRLLPTIRSRCRTLRLSPLGPEDMASALAQAGVEPANADGLTALAGGSVGEAIRLTLLDGLKIYAEVIGLLASLPNLDRARSLALAEAAAQRGAEDKLDLLFSLIETALARLARTGATGHTPVPEAVPGEGEILARLSGHPRAARAWAETAQSALARVRHGRAVNLDPAALVLDTLFKLQETAA